MSPGSITCYTTPGQASRARLDRSIGRTHHITTSQMLTIICYTPDRVILSQIHNSHMLLHNAQSVITITDTNVPLVPLTPCHDAGCDVPSNWHTAHWPGCTGDLTRSRFLAITHQRPRAPAARVGQHSMSHNKQTHRESLSDWH